MARTPRLTDEAMDMLRNCGFPASQEMIGLLGNALNNIARSPGTYGNDPSDLPLTTSHIENLQFFPGNRAVLITVFAEPYKYVLRANVRWDDEHLYVNRIVSERHLIPSDPR